MLMCRNRVWPAVVALSGLLLASLVFTPWASAYRGNALLTGFLNTSSGALFPPCPFIAYLLMGALLGIGAARATGGRRNVVVGLIAMTAVAWLMSQTPFIDRWWHSLGAWDNIQLLPNLFERVYKLGVIILVLCAIERAVTITGSVLRPAIAGLDYLSRNAFLIYFVHLSLIYGFCGIHLMWRWHRKSTWDQYAWRLATLYAGTVLVCWAFARIQQAIADLRERAAAAEAEAPMLAAVAEPA
jgi:surface polysaccharide O-acyltransferase-like enzyme